MLSTRFEQALIYASQLHASQRRKGTEVPYISHLLAVSALVLEHGGDEDTVIAALLHDAIEDQGGEPTRQAITTQFGSRVAEIVESCTDTDTEPKPPWQARKEAHLAHLRTASADALLVVAADKLHNARCVLSDLREQGDEVWGKFKGGRPGTLWYYREMVALLQAAEVPAGTRKLVAELARAVNEIGTLATE